MSFPAASVCTEVELAISALDWQQRLARAADNDQWPYEGHHSIAGSLSVADQRPSSQAIAAADASSNVHAVPATPEQLGDSIPETMWLIRDKMEEARPALSAASGNPEYFRELIETTRSFSEKSPDTPSNAGRSISCGMSARHELVHRLHGCHTSNSKHKWRQPWLIFVLLVMAVSSARAEGLFGSIEFRSNNLSAIPQWTAVIERIQREQATLDACDARASTCPSERVRLWRQGIEAARSYTAEQQLRYVNDFANGIVPYITDWNNYGVNDYWATPLEFMRRSGDCEDYAITKFVSLLELGFTNDQMRIAVLLDTVRNLPHAVLAVELNGRSYILDSLFNGVLEDTSLGQYVPQYSVNLDTRWAHIVR